MKKNTFLIFVCFFLILPSPEAQSFTRFQEQISKTDPGDRQTLVYRFLTAQSEIPVIESDTIVHFLYYGNASSVAIVGDATAWTPILTMTRIEGTNLWYVSSSYEKDARLEYKVVVNDKDWKLDSLNRRIIEGGMGSNSELVMPGYRPAEYSTKMPSALSGSVTDTVIQSMVMKEKRSIRIYLPPGYTGSHDRYPVCYFHDGIEFFNLTAAGNILDNMISGKYIRPVIAVFLEPVHRDEEYSGIRQGDYTRFVTDELSSFIDAAFRTEANPESRAQFGISNGGNISLWIAASHPENTGKVAAFSSNIEKSVTKAFKESSCSNQEIYLDLGTYDIPALLPMVRNLKDLLMEKGCSLSYHEYPEGHNWVFWQKYLPDALMYFFPFNIIDVDENSVK
ncbi:MAG: alpha/beta hydrolase-fold protein [Bacteroidota bacterium]